MTTYHTSRNESIVLGNRINQGGEAIVYATNKPGLVAKEYKTQPDVQKQHKLEAMVAHGKPIPNAAFPVDLLFTAKKQLVGYLMPFVEGEPLHNFGNTKAQKKLSNSYKLSAETLVNIGIELCQSVYEVHRENMVIGDLNDSNFLVDKKLHVSVLDCDSFQFQSWLCGVGRLDYTAPELQGVNLNQVPRDASSDNFSLAIILHQLFVLGIHPFVGKANSPSESELHQRIAKGLCPHLGTAAPPAWCPDLNLLPKPIRDMFAAAFADAALRPTSLEIRNALYMQYDPLCEAVKSYRIQRGLPEQAPSKPKNTTLHQAQQQKTKQKSKSKQQHKPKPQASAKAQAKTAPKHKRPQQNHRPTPSRSNQGSATPPPYIQTTGNLGAANYTQLYKNRQWRLTNIPRKTAVICVAMALAAMGITSYIDNKNRTHYTPLSQSIQQHSQPVATPVPRAQTGSDPTPMQRYFVVFGQETITPVEREANMPPPKETNKEDKDPMEMYKKVFEENVEKKKKDN